MSKNTEEWRDARADVLARRRAAKQRAVEAAHPTAGEAVESEPVAGVTFADTDGSDPDAYDEAESEGE